MALNVIAEAASMESPQQGFCRFGCDGQKSQKMPLVTLAEIEQHASLLFFR